MSLHARLQQFPGRTWPTRVPERFRTTHYIAGSAIMQAPTQPKDTTAQDTARLEIEPMLEEKSKQEPKKVDNSGIKEDQRRRLEEKEAALEAARAEKADAKDYENAIKLQQDDIVPKYVGTEE